MWWDVRREKLSDLSLDLLSLTLLSSDASLLAVELPLGLDDSGGGGDDDLIIDDDGRSVMDLIFSVGGGGGRLGSCRFDGDLRNGRLVCPLLVGAAPPPPPPSLADMNGRATRLEMVADLAELLFLTVVLLPPPFWLVLEDEPAEADRWIPLSPLELPEPLLSEEPCSWVGEMLTCFLGATGAIEALLAVSICAALFLYSAEASSVRVRLRWRRRASRLWLVEGAAG